MQTTWKQLCPLLSTDLNSIGLTILFLFSFETSMIAIASFAVRSFNKDYS